MYISNMTHFLDETGNIPQEMPKEARELASFFALVVDQATQKNPDASFSLHCFNKKCNGLINCELSKDSEEIIWECSKCSNSGRISFWQGTRWDNTKKK
jgi:hypothetical protein